MPKENKTQKEIKILSLTRFEEFILRFEEKQKYYSEGLVIPLLWQIFVWFWVITIIVVISDFLFGSQNMFYPLFILAILYMVKRLSIAIKMMKIEQQQAELKAIRAEREKELCRRAALLGRQERLKREMVMREKSEKQKEKKGEYTLKELCRQAALRGEQDRIKEEMEMQK